MALGGGVVFLFSTRLYIAGKMAELELRARNGERMGVVYFWKSLGSLSFPTDLDFVKAEVTVSLAGKADRS